MPSLHFAMAAFGLSVFGIATASVTNVSELRENFSLASQTFGDIPNCPDYQSVPRSVLDEGVDCLEMEVTAFNNTEYGPGEYPGRCSAACREYYGYFGAECLRAENRAMRSYGQELQRTLADGSLPRGLEKELLLSLINLAVEEDYEVSDLNDIEDILDDIVEDLQNPIYIESVIDACGVPRTGLPSSGSMSQSWSITGFITAALMLL